MEAAAEARKRAGDADDSGDAKRSKQEALGPDVLKALDEVRLWQDCVARINVTEEPGSLLPLPPPLPLSPSTDLPTQPAASQSSTVIPPTMPTHNP